uniref:Uncharacterized protein n=1 Tax=Rhizophora mucronata TaxID=61149 RepID=A0A2P2JGS4_RHIMU
MRAFMETTPLSGMSMRALCAELICPHFAYRSIRELPA